MLTDWMHWLSSLTWGETGSIVLGFVLLDGPRYVLMTTLITLGDLMSDAYRWFTATRPREFTHCPSVCAVIVGLNEGDCLDATLRSLVGTYPRLEIVVCDDGSTDDMSAVARAFMQAHPGLPMKVISRPRRGGKSSALNLALGATNAEIVVTVDGETHVEADTLWEIVQPFSHPSVGLVSGTIRVRNWSTNLCTWCQALEYLQSIVVGRRVSARLGILPLSSGALSAYRRELLVRLGGWDIGPGEDLDIALRIRKLGYLIGFSQFAIGHTEGPATWQRLVKQRFRWDGDSSVRHFIRKHSDLANVTWKNFRLSNFVVFWDAVIFHLLCGIGALISILALLVHATTSVPWHFLALTFYALSVATQIPTFCAIVYYSRTRPVDTLLSLAIPVMPFYRILLSGVRVYANVCEIFWRSSYQSSHVPQHVRQATWRW